MVTGSHGNFKIVVKGTNYGTHGDTYLFTSKFHILPHSAATSPPGYFLGVRSTREEFTQAGVTVKVSKQLKLCILHVEHRTQQVWLDSVGEEIECSLRRSFIRNILQALSRSVNSKRNINSQNMWVELVRSRKIGGGYCIGINAAGS